MALPRLLSFALLVLALAACAGTGAVSKTDALQKAQYAYAAAIRWSDLEGAWALLDPDWRRSHPLGEIERSRYQQVQVTHYRPLTSEPTADGGALRMVEIGVVNRHTQAERSVRYAERWRYDAAAQAWVVTSGLPDFWAGQ